MQATSLKNLKKFVFRMAWDIIFGSSDKQPNPMYEVNFEFFSRFPWKLFYLADNFGRHKITAQQKMLGKHW